MRRSDLRDEIVCLVLLMVLLGWAALEARSFPPRAREFPQLIACAALLLGGVECARLIVSRGAVAQETSLGRGAAVGPVSRYLVWIGCYYAAIFAGGFLLASFFFVALFLRFVARTRWTLSSIASALLVLVLMGFGHFLRLSWPGGALANWVAALR